VYLLEIFGGVRECILQAAKSARFTLMMEKSQKSSGAMQKKKPRGKFGGRP